MDPISLMAIFAAGALLAERRETASIAQVGERDEDFEVPDPALPSLWQLLGIGPIRVLWSTDRVYFPGTKEEMCTAIWHTDDPGRPMSSNCWRAQAPFAEKTDPLWELIQDAWYGRGPEVRLQIVRGLELVDVPFLYPSSLEGSVKMLPGQIKVDIGVFGHQVADAVEAMTDDMSKSISSETVWVEGKLQYVIDPEIQLDFLRNCLDKRLYRRFGNRICLGKLLKNLYSESFDLAMNDLSEIFRKFRERVIYEAEQAKSDIDDIENKCRILSEKELTEYAAK